MADPFFRGSAPGLFHQSGVQIDTDAFDDTGDGSGPGAMQHGLAQTLREHPELREPGRALVSDNFAALYHIEPGDHFTIAGLDREAVDLPGDLAGMQGVLEAGAVGVPDARTGEAVKLVVVRKDPALQSEHATGEIRAAASRRVTRIGIPPFGRSVN